MVFEEGWAVKPLRWLMDEMGEAQLARMGDEPGLVAAIDQHAAELRDTVPLDKETLRDYLLGFLDELRDRGWVFDGRLDPPALRLMAVCWLARELGYLEDGRRA